MTESEMKQRTKAFALRIIKLAGTLSKDFVGRRLADQLLRSGTSVAANYRVEGGIVFQRRLSGLLDEANQLTAIMVASRKSLNKRRNQKSKF